MITRPKVQRASVCGRDMEGAVRSISNGYNWRRQAQLALWELLQDGVDIVMTGMTIMIFTFLDVCAKEPQTMLRTFHP